MITFVGSNIDDTCNKRERLRHFLSTLDLIEPVDYEIYYTNEVFLDDRITISVSDPKIETFLTVKYGHNLNDL